MDLASFLPEELRGPDRQDHLARYFELVERCSIQQLKAVILDMEARECRERIVCNCWHAGKCESDALWKLYGNQLGVALVSTVGRLARSFKGRYSQIVCAPDPQEYTMASVRYVDESKLGKLDDFHVKHWWLLKRNSFAHESEIRVFHRLSNAVDAHEGGIQIDVDVQQMIEEIVLNPFNPRWVSEALRAAILLILEKNNLKIHVGQSAHAKPPTASNPILATIEIDRLRASFGVKRRKPH